MAVSRSLKVDLLAMQGCSWIPAVELKQISTEWRDYELEFGQEWLINACLKGTGSVGNSQTGDSHSYWDSTVNTYRI